MSSSENVNIAHVMVGSRHAANLMSSQPEGQDRVDPLKAATDKQHNLARLHSLDFS